MALTFKEALDKYDVFARARGFSSSTIAHTHTCMDLFESFLGPGRTPVDITTDDFRRFVADLRQRQQRRPARGGATRRLSGTSVNTYVRAIRAFFSWLKRDGLLEANPLATEAPPKKPKTLPKVYSEGELKAILQAVAGDLRNKAIVFLLLDTGLRLSELSEMTLQSVDTKEGHARVTGKGDKQRLVPVHPWACEAIDDYVKNGRSANTDTVRLFLKSRGQPVSARGIQSMLARLGEAAGLKERLSPHKLRHTFATVSLKYGGNLEYIKQIMGHSDIKTTSEAYLNVDSADIKAAHDRFSPLANVLGHPPDGSEGADKDKEGGTLPVPPADRKFEKEQPGEKVGATGDDIRPFHRERYDQHLRRLAALAGELAADIEAGNLEPPRFPDPEARKTFKNVDLARVYRAQNSRLWTSLAQHLDNEFDRPRLTTRIVQAAADQLLKRVGIEGASAKKNAEAVLAKLAFLGERGTFEGTCEICRSYFERRKA